MDKKEKFYCGLIPSEDWYIEVRSEVLDGLMKYRIEFIEKNHGIIKHRCLVLDRSFVEWLEKPNSFSDTYYNSHYLLPVEFEQYVCGRYRYLLECLCEKAQDCIGRISVDNFRI